MFEIKDRDELEAWLKTRPSEDAVLIAARAALRVLPLTVLALPDAVESRRAKETRAIIVLPIWRALAAASVAGVWPALAPEIRSFYGIAVSSSAIRAKLASSHYAVQSTASAAEAAVDVLIDATGNVFSLDATAFAAAAAASIGGDTFSDGSAFSDGSTFANEQAHADVFSAVERDAALLDDQSFYWGATHPGLWDGPPPDWAAEHWGRLREHLRHAGEGWEVWIDWYEARLAGRPGNPNLEYEIVTLPNEDWEAGPAVVNAKIAGLVAKYGSKHPLPAEGALPQQRPSGHTFGGRHDEPVKVEDPPLEDAVRDDAIARDFHAEVLDAAHKLQSLCLQSNETGGVADAVKDYVEKLGSGPPEVRLSLIIRGEALRNLRDADVRLQKLEDPLPPPMAPGVFALLETLIAAHSQYVGTDPTLDRIQRRLADPEALARTPVTPAQSDSALEEIGALLTNAARAALASAASAARAISEAGKRALVWLNESWRNLAIELTRRILHQLRQSARALMDEAVIAAQLTIEDAVAAARAITAETYRRARHGTIAFGAIEAHPTIVEAVREFSAATGAPGRALRFLEDAAGAAAGPIGFGVGIVVLVLVAHVLIKRRWFFDLVEDEDLQKMLKALRPGG